MEKHVELNEILNDLVKINRDRIAGYERAVNEFKNLGIELKTILTEMISESRQYKGELASHIREHGGIVEESTSASGKIYAAWKALKATLADTSRHAILSSCEFVEDAVQRAYKAALLSTGLFDPRTKQLVANEQSALKKSHELIKKHRESMKAMQK